MKILWTKVHDEVIAMTANDTNKSSFMLGLAQSEKTWVSDQCYTKP